MGARLVAKIGDQTSGDRDPNLPFTLEQCAQVIGLLSLADNEWMWEGEKRGAPAAPSDS